MRQVGYLLRLTILESGKTKNKAVATDGSNIENWSLQTIMLKDYRCTR
jgi:hypothetical protein